MSYMSDILKLYLKAKTHQLSGQQLPVREYRLEQTEVCMCGCLLSIPIPNKGNETVASSTNPHAVVLCPISMSHKELSCLAFIFPERYYFPVLQFIFKYSLHAK